MGTGAVFLRTCSLAGGRFLLRDVLSLLVETQNFLRVSPVLFKLSE